MRLTRVDRSGKLDLSILRKEKLKSFENKEIVLGIRPEAFEDGHFANQSDYSESIKVKVYNFLSHKSTLINPQ